VRLAGSSPFYGEKQFIKEIWSTGRISSTNWWKKLLGRLKRGKCKYIRCS
jgi:hypothetical protein